MAISHFFLRFESRSHHKFDDNDMNKDPHKSLFGDSIHNPSQLNHSLGSDVHEWSDETIEKVVSIRFGGDYNLFIRQLSRDITQKEQDIILLRDFYLRRERQFYKVCASHANLTHLEVDKLLDDIQQKDTVDDVLLDMISVAMKEPLAPTLKREPPTTISSNLAQQPDIEAHSSESERRGWLRGWIQSPNDLRYEWVRSTSSLHSGSRTPKGTEDAPIVPPLELVSMSQPGDSTILDPEELTNTDPYGFITENGSENPKRQPGDGSNFDARSSVSQVVNPIDSSYATLQEVGRRHDDEKQAIEARWNTFCNEVMKLRNERNQEETFVPTFGLKALELKTLDRQISFKEDSYLKRLQSLISKQGIPPGSRSKFWFELSGASNIRVPGEYNRLVELAKMHANDPSLIQSFNQIDLDLHRTMPSNVYFHNSTTSLPGPLHHRLKRILDAFVVLRSDIGYVQGMNKIVGNLLIADKRVTEEDTFWLFVSLIDEILPTYHGESYFSPSSLKHIRNAQTELAQVQFALLMPKLYTHLKQLDVQIEFITMNWWLLVFTDICNLMELWYRVIDNLLVSDKSEDFLKALSLGIFKHYEKKLLSLDNYDDVYVLMNRNATRNIGFRELMEITRELERKIGKMEKDRGKRWE